MKSVIEDLEKLIRNGQFDEVEVKLRKLGKVDRAHAVAIANIARRINQLSLAIRILNPIVRSDDKLQAPATALEKIEYAEALRRAGAVDEAWALLEEVDSKEYPQATVHKVFCLFNQWKYQESLALLKEYIENETLSPYARCVGKINLAAALISIDDLPQASRLLKSLQRETKESEFLLLHGNSLELFSQVLILEKNYDEALKVLDEANECLKKAGSVANLFVQKWSAIAESLKQNEVTDELQQVFLKAQNQKHWETVRDCDLYIAFLSQDQERFARLYVGTPYQSFRERIIRFAGPNFQAPNQYVWKSSQTFDTSIETVLDLATGKVEGRMSAELPIGQALHRFLILLSQDQYRPVSVLTAFGKLFPDEYMNANTSANRVYQIVRRCRSWIQENKLPLELEEVEGSYRLKVGDKMGLQVPSKLLPLDDRELQWSFFQKHIQKQKFDIHQATAILKSSLSTTYRLLKWAVDDGRLRKQGKGSKTSYQVAAESQTETRDLRTKAS